MLFTFNQGRQSEKWITYIVVEMLLGITMGETAILGFRWTHCNTRPH